MRPMSKITVAPPPLQPQTRVPGPLGHRLSSDLGPRFGGIARGLAIPTPSETRINATVSGTWS